MKSKSDKRLIIECKVNNKPANFLIDTGASIALIDNNQASKYSLIRGRKDNGVITGAGGNIEDTYILDNIENDKIVTLITCTYDNQKRFIVRAKYKSHNIRIYK